MSQQNIYVDLNSIQSGEGITELTVVYDATDAEASGLGLRIHYDSSQLSVNGVSNVLQSDLVFAYDTPSSDSQDFDNDVTTDQYIDLGWASLYGDWPGSVPINLVTISFADSNLAETTVNFSASSHAVGYDFVGQSIQLSASSGEDVPPVFTSSDNASVDENTGESRVVYTASSDASSTVTYSLVDNTVYAAETSEATAPELVSATQMVSAADVSSAQAGGQLSLTVNYSADDNQLSGLGLRIHFDSSLITVAEMTNIFAQDQIFVDAETQADTDDYDANAATDSFVTAAWASVDGDWPNTEIPSELLTVLFDVSADASGTAAVGFSAIDTAIGYDFSAPSYDITITGSPLSIDAATGEVSLSDNPDFESQDSYMFTVTATDTSGNAVEQAVTLSVNNLDEAAPVITSADSAAIDEDTGAGQVIYTATADDSADTSDGVSYSLVDSSVYTATSTSADAPVDTQLVSVASYTAPDANGQIAVTVNYNADDNQLSGLGLRIHYDSSLLTVADVTDALAQDLIYTDSGYYGDTDDLDANASTDAYITVGWASVGGDWPNTELPEELLTILFDLTGDAIAGAGGSAAIGFSSTSTPVGYDFSGTGYNLELIESPLSIDSATGEVTLSENPDYDVRDAYSFSVTATDAAGNASSAQAVIVTINEAPDLPPVFTSPDTASVDENIGSQQVVYTAASDSSSEIVYSLADNTVYPGSQENANQADLLANTSMVSASGVSSAEAGEQVSLAINYNADDNQLPGLGLRIHYDSSKLTVAGVSNVLDQDLIYTDTAPQADAGDFDADASTDAYITVGWASLAGNWPDADLPSELLNVLFDVAADAEGDAAVGFSSTSTPVGYEFAGEGYDIEIITSPLEIDSVTGEVTLIDNPDFETQESYNFTVTATDASGNAVDQAVTLSVNNLDEATPVINSADSVTIDEDTGAGQVIYTATADDSADTSDGVSYSLVDSSVYTATSTNADAPVDTQLVSVASYTAPDANGQIAVTVNYNADDNQLSGLGLRVHYDSSVLSVADITDVLAQDLIYTDSAAETDADDLDANASTDAFVTLGWASVGGDWPNAELPEELLTILFDVATDASGSAAIGFSSTSTPVGYDFSGNGYALELIESPLSMDSATGEVTLSENPDYDVRDAYSFSVTATDAAGNVSAPQAVTVTVNEVDDIPPVITSNDSVAVDENSGVNQVIYTATADDSDISFSLSEDSDSALTIDSATGEVTLAADPDHETQSQYSFSIIATDSAGNTSDAQAVSLDINNLDEVAPVITSGDSAAAVDENSVAGQVVYTVSADDSADVSDGVSYSLVDDTDYSNTNTNSQQLSDDLQMVSVSGSPVAFGGEQVEISVAYNADDNQLPGLGLRVHFDSTKLSVAQVRDVLDQDLIFIDADTQSDADDYDADASTDSFVTVAWASMNGNWPNEDLPSDLLTVVFDVASDTSGDASIGFSAISTAVGYELSATSYDLEIVNSPLSIDSATGEVTLVESPDFEAQDSYNFTVVATDAAGNVSDSQSVSLDVNNLDEQAPTITSDAATIAIDENSGAGQVVYTATADDSIDISNGVSFSLVESYGHMNNVSSDPAISINAETGEVTLADNPDYEAQGSYFFAVVATDAAGNTGNMQSMMIEVNNLDEVAPAITSVATATAVDENSGAGQVVYTATAEDSADTSNGFTFSLADGSDAALTIDSATGEVTLATDPDHETQNQYSFSVIATDAVGNASDAQAVTLDINDLDDAAPAITSGATAVVIDENSGAGQVVYTATADDSADDVSDTPITYSLEEGSDAALSINSDTGEVTLNTDPDHETQSQYSFAVIATDAAGNQSNAQSVSLEINDLDDAAPIIISGDSAVAINENSGAGQIIYTATSNDSADNVSDTPITYSLSEDSDTALSIDPASGDVTLTNNPDHEAQSQYSFVVIATDAAGNASEAQSVTLDINDLDDAAPSITSGAVADTIDENSGAGQVVYTATADDSADDVADTPIIYSLTSDSDTGLSIDSVTGVVTLNSNPDYESQSQYSFAVIATDNAGNTSEAQAVNLEINNLDDAAPTITSGATAVAIDENSGAEQVIYTATADDSADISEGITFSLAEGSDAELSIDSATGAVTLASVPNYETQSQYSFAVIATDAAGNTSAAQSVTLDINNLDEVAPTITSGDSAAVLESSGADALVYRALADDSADVSAGVTFSLSEDSDTALSINTETGEVTLADEPDFAVKPSYSFTVIADDGVNQSQKAVSLSVVDEDLEAPVFTSLTAVAIDENIGENQVIYTAITNDESLVNYSLSEDSDISLSIDLASGAVTLATDPDSEAQSEYSFTVIATDIANNVSQQTVTVSINDLDDAAPTVTSGAVADAIDENSGAGQVIYTVIADDSGDDVAATPITYSLAEGSDTGLSIDALTGAVSLIADPNHESQSEYSFAVVATDAAGNASEAQSVTLNINDLDDAAPTITSGAVASIIDENTGAGQVIYTATADDSADISDGYSFSLAEGSDAGLTIDVSSGAVSLTADPDHETQSQYSFAVIATDAAGNSSAAQSVVLNINDLDDASPTITSADTATAIDENSGAGQVIYSAGSDDSADDVVKGPISYSLAEGSDADLTIDAQSGLVTLAADPNHELQAEYSFAVIATDGAGNASEPKAVTLNINDLDDAAPSITSGETATTIDENSGAGQVIYTATADDSSDVSDGASFSLADGSDSALSIDATSGEVTLASDPDHEAQNQYSFSVIATDAAGNQSATQAVTLDINDLDDADPALTSSDSADAINENSGAGQVVYTATADDSADISDGVSFSLASATTYSDAPELVENTQHVYVSQSTLSDDGSQVSVVVSYNSLVSDTTGLGLRIHFNSNELTFNVQSDVLDTDFIFSANVAVADDADYDTDSSTDTYLDAGWASVSGNWPDEGMPADLMTLTFDINPEASTQTVLGVSAISSPVGLAFEGEMYDLALDSGSMSAGSAFSINSETGEVTLLADPDFESASEYSFSVMATDAAGNTSELQDVSLSVNNLDEIAPVITSVDTVDAIDENSGAGQVIYTAAADDSADLSGGFTFSLDETSDAAISIDSSSGEVTLTTNSDYEVQNQYSFVVIATDAAGNQSDEKSITLSINNLDDTAPIITSANTAAAIDENSGAEQVIYTATADDSSDVSDGVSFSLADGSDSALSIDASTGEVTLASDPDHETQSQYSFSVIATDAAGNQSASQAVTLDINDLDDADPVLTSSDTATAIDENSGADQVVYTATADDSSDISDGVSFSLASDTAYADVPDLAANTQHVYVSQSTLSDDGTQVSVVVSYSALVAATTGLGLRVHFNSNELTFNAQSDVLDTDLIFSADAAVADDADYDANASTDSYLDVGWASVSGNWPDEGMSADLMTLTFDINSEAPSQTVIGVSAISSPVGIAFDGQMYDLALDSGSMSAGSAFSIDSETGEVTLLANPDFESASEYSFSVMATDAAGNTSELQDVSLSINNLDESAPVITSGVDASIDENSGAGQVVYTATADDSSDVSDGVTFSLGEASDAALSIDSVSGAVTLTTDSDYEVQNQYSFVVIATDVAGNQSDAQSVTLTINNVDDTAPTITSADTAAAINENTGVGQVVYTATADDSSDVSNGVTFSLSADSDSALSIDASSGEVSLNADPDFETQSQYSFTVIASDGVNADSQQTVTLDINNVDEVAPVIISDSGSSIDENTGAGQVIYTATSDDSADVSDGVTYSLVDGTSYGNDDSDGEPVDTGPLESEVSIPELVAATQHVYVSSSTKSEDGTQETLVVSYNADDTTSTGLGLRIHFDSSQLSVANLEGVLSQDNIFANSTAQADTDNADNDASTDMYIDMAWASLFGQWPGSAPTDLATLTFDIVEGASGSSAINFTASSNASGFAFEGQTHNVAISNESENESEIESVVDVVDDTQHLYISESKISEDGTQTSLVVSYDALQEETTGLGLRIHFDSDVLSYSDISDVLAADLIFANASATADTEDFDNNSATDMFVDAGWASLYSNWPNEALPTDLLTLTFDIENTEIESTAIGLSSIASPVGFSFDGQAYDLALTSEPSINSDLSIDSTTGEVTLAANPDYETESEYSFSVIATDAAGNVSDTQEVTVSVNNLDETAPTITSVDTGSIDENSGLGQVIYTATADDSADVSEDLSFSLAAGSDSELSIDSATGEVTLATDPNFEAQSQYSFTIVATDSANNSADQQVTITVNNLDEVAPTITSADTAVAIDENTGAGQVVYTAIADDSADVSNGVTFSLSADSDSALSIDASSGEVSLNADPDFETQSQYSFTVIASDGVNADSQQTLTLDINNVDEVAPVITSDSGSSINENSGAGQVIYTATSDDSADVSDGVTYSLVDGTSYGNDDSDGEPVDTGPLESEVSVPELSASTQHVYVSSSTKSEDGTQETIVISYNADDTTTTGLGLRIHFDSSQLSVASLEGVLSQDNIFANSTAQADTDNSDNNASTDMYVDMAWASLFGQWPGSAPTDLATLTFDIAEGASGSSAINFTASSNASGYTFAGQAHNIAISNGSEAQPDPEATLDYVGEAPEVQANTQQIFVSESQVATTLSDQGDLQGYAVISYTSDQVESTGLGLRIHFASDNLDIISITDALGTDIVFTNSEATQDTNDYDNNPSSDRFVDIGWASVYGNWPDGDLPADLLTINFAANPNSVESPTLSFSAIDSPVGLNFVGHDYVIGTETDSDQDDNNGSELNSDISINSETGEVTLAVNPDYETESEYNFAVVATDAEGNASGPQNVTISINNLDEVAPVMSPGQINPVIDENSGAGQVVYLAVADDSQDISAGITFSLSEDSDTGLSIDELTGEVVLEANPNYETQSEYNFTVIASDSVNLDVEQSVTLQINNLDEVAPVFTSSDSAGSMDENSNSAVSQVIYTAVADDSLDISNGITYSLIDENGGAISGSAESVVYVPELAAATQHVYVSSSTKSEDGTQETIVISYNADDTTTTGLGLRIHFDSSVLSASDITALVGTDLLVNGVVESDASDLDGDASTDQIISFGWASLFGSWPGSAPADLASITFDIAEGATGSSAINFTASSNAAGFAFDGQSHEVAITAEATSALSINSETGEVSLAVNPDYEIQDEYSFTVIASDGVNNPVEQQVTLDINNIDEVSPIITSGAEVTQIEENSGAGQVVYTATADDSQDTSAGVTFALSSDSDAALSIDASTGAVTLADAPDFETQEDYNFTVIASDGVNQDAQQSLTLSITDLDDTGPIITSPDQVSADENVGADAVVYTVTTNDTGPVSYELISVLQIEEGAIDQRYVDNGDGSITLQLFVDESIASNYANGLQNYDLLITYNDDEITDPQISFPDIAILATSFESVPGEIQTATIIFPGSLTVNTDPLLELTYQLEAGVNSAEIGVLDVLLGDDAETLPDSVARYYGTQGFSIDSATGEVSIDDNPDHEMQVSYDFTVAATDSAGNQSEAVTVNLSINDLDDSAPTFVSADSINAIDENSGAGQVIYTANADDSGDISDGVTYSLTGDSDSALEIDSISGQVTLLDNPDYEAQSTYSFTLVATDAAGNESEGLSLSVAVNNLDDTAPVITSANAIDAIDENSGQGQVVYTATADDSFDVESGALVFSLSEDSDSALTIDASTGEVSLTTDTDYESQSQYSFAVIATDAAGNASDAQLVTLDINNLDEVAATITSSDSVSASENSGADQVIYTATADDSADISGGVTFSLAEGSDSALSIDAQTGDVTLADNPDYETQDIYSFTVVATDAAGNVSDQLVTLDISNLDDTAATITSGDTAVAVDENSGAGQVIYTATADDSADVSDGVIFSLAAGSDSALSIDADTGAVTLNTDPDFETQSEYSFAVVATDAAGNVSQAQSVTLDINNLDDTAATITSGDTAAAIDENSGAGQVIYTATADDSADVSDGVTFSLAAGSDAAVAIDAATGAVTLTTDPDFETQSAYSFAVVATDAAGNVSQAQSVTLDINNVDDTAATITSGDTADAIDENSGAGQVIYTATADDSADVSDGFTFSLAEGSDPALSIDANTGAVTLTTDTDYETQSQYSFSVVATDAAGNHSEAQSVTLDINDLDEVAPTITSVSTAAVDENMGQNQVIYTVTSDDTSDISQGVTYSLGETADSALSIDANTGEVSLSTDPDYETQSEYQFTVFATDAAGNQSAAQTVTISINDLDDSAVSGMVYHWGTQTMMDNVSISMHSQSDGEMMSTMTTDSSGAFAMTDLPSGDVTLTVERDMQEGDGSRVVTSADVLGALKIAVGMNPNTSSDGQQNMVSPYQFIAADVNKDGRVSSADALAILHMAVNMPNAIDQEWMFVAEDTDFWNEDAAEGENPFSTNKYDVDWDSDGTDMSLTHPAQMNYVGVMLGDVNNSWSAPEDAIKMPQSHLNQLEADGIAPLEQWNLSPDADIVPPTIVPTSADAVVENSGAGQVVYTANSFDNSATFSLSADSDPALTINGLTGAITLADNPDYEAQSQYSFAVIATDAAGNDSVAHQVTVEITNVDDAEPTITSAGTAVAINENSGAGQVVYTATADDSADVSDGVTFSLADETLGFSIDEVAGVVTTNGDFAADYETAQTQSFTVVATDVAGNASEQSVTLDINNLDDTAPTVTSSDTGTAVDEGSGEGQVVYTATADDSVDVSDGVTFSLADETVGFSINVVTGVVTTNGDFAADFEAAQSQTFTVVATDAAGNDSVEQEVTIAINNLDEIAPTITSVDTASVLESADAGVPVYQAVVDDSADISAVPITYGITGVDASAFSVNESGLVTMIVDPNASVKVTYSFNLVATDDALNSSQQSITLTVFDQDLEGPVFTSATTAAINENSGDNQVVYIPASQDQSGPVTYALAQGHDSALSIDDISGEVILNTNPDYEVESSYSFTIVATDGSDQNNTSQQEVILSINNLDEVAPTINSGATGTAVDENSDAGQVVYTASATDTDFNGAEDITFSLKGNPLGFSIDENGVVTTTDGFAANFEDAQTQSFTVVATDATGNASEQEVTIAINNLDEVAPTINSGATGSVVDENSGAGQIVYTATADDSADVADTPIAYSLAEGSDAALTIDASTGAVTLNTDPDADTQSQYSFAVVATDAAGNASVQSVTLDINNLDEAAPTITSAAETVMVDADETNPVIYTATADDSADISGGVSFSLNDTTVYASTDSGSAESTVSIPELAASTQHVYVSSSTKSEDGTQETVVVSYNADDSTTTGLGLRIHFDSSVLSESDISTLMTNDLLVNAVVESDDSDLDGDASTDKYIAFGWASLFGQWPNAAPADLASITFDIAESATGSSAINFTISSNAAGFAFDGQNHQVAITGEAAPVESQLSIDPATGEVTLSGELDPATQSEYSFTVTATDTAGNSSDLGVVVDAEQPMVDAAMVVVVDGDTPSAPIYQASANIDNVSYQITDLTQYPDTDSGSGSAESQISIPQLAAATQHVYVSSSTKSEDGTQETVVVSYNADDTTTTGLGLRIHFDSSVLSASDITTLMTNDLLVNAVVESDDSDFDGDASTDTYVQFGWASLFGQWPNAAPVDLASITFDIAEGATGSSAINFSTSSNAAGFAFDGQDHNLVLAAEAVVPAAELVIDNAAGTVSLDAAANSDVMADYSFRVEGTDADGDAVGSQTVPVVVVDQIVNADASSYTGTADEDVFALADGSAEITSGAGEDDFVLDPAFASASHTITDFESGVDAIDISAALVAAGYTADNAPTQLASAEMSADILDLVNGDDSSLDNLFGATYDDASNTLTVFADSDSSAGSTDMDSFQITLDDNATVEDDDIVANLSPFIA